jgi:hypothetical protein
MEEGRWKQKKKEGRRFGLGEFILLNPVDTGKDPLHPALGRPAKGFLQGLRGEVFLQKRPHFHAGFPAIDEISAGKVGLDPAAVIKRHHGSHLGAINFQKIVLVNHEYLA